MTCPSLISCFPATHVYLRDAEALHFGTEAWLVEVHETVVVVIRCLWAWRRRVRRQRWRLFELGNASAVCRIAISVASCWTEFAETGRAVRRLQYSLHTWYIKEYGTYLQHGPNPLSRQVCPLLTPQSPSVLGMRIGVGSSWGIASRSQCISAIAIPANAAAANMTVYLQIILKSRPDYVYGTDGEERTCMSG